MQHRRREAREPFQAAAHIEIADQRRDARRAKFGAAPGMTGQCKDVRARL
jgi:hypothetical protein